MRGHGVQMSSRLKKIEREARSQVFKEAFRLARGHKDVAPCILNKWITAELLLAAVDAMVPMSFQGNHVNENYLKRELGKMFPDLTLYKEENKSGVALFNHGRKKCSHQV